MYCWQEHRRLSASVLAGGWTGQASCRLVWCRVSEGGASQSAILFLGIHPKPKAMIQLLNYFHKLFIVEFIKKINNSTLRIYKRALINCIFDLTMQEYIPELPWKRLDIHLMWKEKTYEVNGKVSQARCIWSHFCKTIYQNMFIICEQEIHKTSFCIADITSGAVSVWPGEAVMQYQEPHSEPKKTLTTCSTTWTLYLDLKPVLMVGITNSISQFNLS